MNYFSRLKLHFLVLCVFLGASLFIHAPLQAKEFKVAVVYGLGSKFDKSFNEAVFNGMERFRKETKISFKEFETMNETQGEQFLRQLARHGTDLVITSGFDQAQAVAKVAKEFPNIKFVIIDAAVDLPNVQSIGFREHEGAFLVGALAALKSEKGKVGFVGGMDIPLLRKFSCGFVQGAKYINPKVEFYQNMIGSTHTAWSDPTRASELAISQFDRGVDVIFTAAGRSSLGVLQAAADKDKYAIGVDSNQNYLYPGHVLTSMIKQIDLITYQAAMDFKNDTWKPGIKKLGLKEQGVDWVVDEFNKPELSDDLIKKVNQIKADIISGKIKIVDYTVNNSCPY